jgi:NAD(P)-dependent dehydrogenase (short-subunit alcohol dehydrogenase family)
VITGADSGIGRAVALACAREGAEVVVLTADNTHYGERELETLSHPVRRPLRAVTR